MKNTNQLEFDIKLLPEKNIVIIKCKGYEDELFLPSIVKNRISFQNAIPCRRCCNTSNITLQPIIYKQKETNKLLDSNNEVNLTRISLEKPAANSTPLVKLNKPIANECVPNKFSSIEMLSTPQPVRHQNNDSSLKICALQYKHMPCDAMNDTENVPANFDNDDMSDFDSGYVFPASPDTTVHQIETIAKPDLSVVKWRKCITPKRTYSRQKNNQPLRISNSIQNSSYSNDGHDSDDQCSRTKKKQFSQTEGLVPTYNVEVRRRKLIVDKQITLSFDTLKKQISKIYSNTVKPVAKKKSLNNSLSKPSTKFFLPKSRKQYDATKTTIFALLTSSNHSKCIAEKLQQQFRKGCINKASSTYPKYKVFTDIPPLELDEQICKLMKSRK